MKIQIEQDISGTGPFTWTFEDGQYFLTSKECDELIQILKNKLEELK